MTETSSQAQTLDDTWHESYSRLCKMRETDMESRGGGHPSCLPSCQLDAQALVRCHHRYGATSPASQITRKYKARCLFDVQLVLSELCCVTQCLIDREEARRNPAIREKSGSTKTFAFASGFKGLAP